MFRIAGRITADGFREGREVRTLEYIEDRLKEAIKGERIVDEAVIRFHQWCESLNVVPTIVSLRSKLEKIVEAEIKKTLQSLNSSLEIDQQTIDNLKNAIINKVLHDPTLLLKSNVSHRNQSLYLDITRKLFNLDE